VASDPTLAPSLEVAPGWISPAAASIEAEQVEDLPILERFGLQRFHVGEHLLGQAQVFLLHGLHFRCALHLEDGALLEP
jgi:hypothetical protein